MDTSLNLDIGKFCYKEGFRIKNKIFLKFMIVTLRKSKWKIKLGFQIYIS